MQIYLFVLPSLGVTPRTVTELILASQGAVSPKFQMMDCLSSA